jgi:hypothetical protein
VWPANLGPLGSIVGRFYTRTVQGGEQRKKFMTLLAFSALGAVWQLVRDRSRTFESALVWKHREHRSPSIEGAQAKHRARADIGPAKEFLRKEYTFVPHRF